jgi:hypothetical protein
MSTIGKEPYTATPSWWMFVSSCPEQRMSRLVSRLAVATAMVCAAFASSQAWSEPAKKAKITVDPQEQRYNRSVFSGNEIRFAAMHNVNADCSGGPIPQVRLRTEPAHGTVRVEEFSHIVNRAAGDARVYCNGKQVGALGLFYKSAEGFVGEDTITVEVDFKTGTVRRYRYTIEVR